MLYVGSNNIRCFPQRFLHHSPRAMSDVRPADPFCSLQTYPLICECRWPYRYCILLLCEFAFFVYARSQYDAHIQAVCTTHTIVYTCKGEDILVRSQSKHLQRELHHGAAAAAIKLIARNAWTACWRPRERETPACVSTCVLCNNNYKLQTLHRSRTHVCHT